MLLYIAFPLFNLEILELISPLKTNLLINPALHWIDSIPASSGCTRSMECMMWRCHITPVAANPKKSMMWHCPSPLVQLVNRNRSKIKIAHNHRKQTSLSASSQHSRIASFRSIAAHIVTGYQAKYHDCSSRPLLCPFY